MHHPIPIKDFFMECGNLASSSNDTQMYCAFKNAEEKIKLKQTELKMLTEMNEMIKKEIIEKE